MINVGVFAARNRLPDLLKQVAERGERVTITNRGEPVADLVPSRKRATQVAQEAIIAIKANRRGLIDQARFVAMRRQGRR